MQISTLLHLRSYGITVLIKKISCLANSSLVFLKCPISSLVFCLQQEMVNDNFFKRLSKILFHGFLSMFASATVLFCIIYHILKISVLKSAKNPNVYTECLRVAFRFCSQTLIVFGRMEA